MAGCPHLQQPYLYEYRCGLTGASVEAGCPSLCAGECLPQRAYRYLTGGPLAELAAGEQVVLWAAARQVAGHLGLKPTVALESAGAPTRKKIGRPRKSTTISPTPTQRRIAGLLAYQKEMRRQIAPTVAELKTIAAELEDLKNGRTPTEVFRPGKKLMPPTEKRLAALAGWREKRRAKRQKQEERN